MPWGKLMTINLVWCQSIWEADWIRDLFGSTDFIERQSPALDFFADDSVYVLSRPGPLTQMPRSFVEGLSRIRGKLLFHLSDETFCGGYEFYRHFDGVIRNYYISLLDCPGILTVPLGYANGQRGSGDLIAASKRGALWGFTGSVNPDRQAMLAAFRTVEPNHCHVYENKWGQVQDRRTRDATAYQAMLADCVFIPCPMGNTTPDTMRPYEALEWGAIPIVRRRPLIDYFSALMPGHPLPTFLHWSDARDFVAAMAPDKNRLDRLQAEVSHWWTTYKATLRRRVSDFVGAAQASATGTPALADWSFRTDFVFQARRISELIRHSTLGSLKERAAITMSRIGAGLRRQGR